MRNVDEMKARWIAGVGCLLTLGLSTPAAFAHGRTCGGCPIPTDARVADVSNPDHVIGDGTPAGCTSASFVAAVAQGGVITFDCGPDPVTITLSETALVYNDAAPQVVIDGGGLITLDGGGERRILYMNTCDPDLVWTTPHCDNQDHPQLTLQNLTFRNGDSSGEDPDGGGAVYARGGRLKVVNCRFENNACDSVGPDVGGAAIRAFDQYQDLPLYVVHSTFGGAPGRGNVCSNGGALSSIGVSYTVINSEISYNQAIGWGGNPAQPGTPGGGSGGAIYNDGNTFHLDVCGSRIHHNEAVQYSGAIFFVSNDHTGTLTIEDTAVWECADSGTWIGPLPWVNFIGLGEPIVIDSTFDVPAPDLFCDGFASGDATWWAVRVP
jgi:hypothetical protein